MFQYIDWHQLAAELDDILDEGGTVEDAKAHMRLVIDSAARATDAAFNFDALINGPAEPIGDLLEALDYAIVKASLDAVLTFALNAHDRRDRRIDRLRRRLASTPDNVPAYGRINNRLMRLVAKQTAENAAARKAHIDSLIR